MKQMILVLVFMMALFAVSPYTTIAISDDSVESKISVLVEMIQKLQKQLDDLRSGLPSEVPITEVSPSIFNPSLVCPDIDRVLQNGVSGQDVRSLQEFLRSTGDYSYSDITGYYGPITEAAVQKFQKREKVVSSGSAWSNGFGIFGPLTRKAIYRYCKTPEPVMCTMEYAPVCGQPQTGCEEVCYDNGICSGTCSALSVPQAYSNKCHMKAAGASFLYEGECRAEESTIPNNCRVWYDGCNTCSRIEPGGGVACTLMACFAHNKPYCKEYFDDDKNKPPVISSFSGPTVLETGETGTWTIKASDPENDSLTYSIKWGYESHGMISAMDAREDLIEFVQTTKFEHSYDSAGTYTVTISVKDEEGNVVRTSSTVRVAEKTHTECTMEYAPVCGQPPMPECPEGLLCAQVEPEPKMYSNKCMMRVDGAVFVHEGKCDT